MSCLLQCGKLAYHFPVLILYTFRKSQRRIAFSEELWENNVFGNSEKTTFPLISSLPRSRLN